MKLFNFLSTSSLKARNRTNAIAILRTFKSMTSVPPLGADHSQRTAANFRQNIMSEATVLAATDISPFVKSLLLKVHDQNLSFIAGQWVDVFLPDVDQVGGFSMVSPPCLLEQTGQIELAIKKSGWPPAHWVHTCCKAGDKFHVRVGGDFHYDPPTDSKMPDMIFVAGGVGINPLLSIIRQLQFVHRKMDKINRKNFPRKITLLYSAKTEDEILFKDVIMAIKKSLRDSFDFKFFVTRSQPSADSLKDCRITDEDLREALDQSNKDDLLCFLCGPPPMTDRFTSALQEMGVPPPNIRYEKWW